MSKITIKNVAEKAGVSVTSVSRVLNNRGYISDDLRSKVMEAIDELNYTPNEIARSFYKSETKSVALIVPTIHNPFFSELAFYIERELSKDGYHLYIGNSLNDSVNEREYLKMLKEQRVDGMIVGSHNIEMEEYDKITGNIVSVERKINDEIPMIESDNYLGGKLATERLIQQGCRKIICISGSQTIDSPASNRVIAYSDVMQKNNLKEQIVEIPFAESADEKHRRVKEIFTSKIEFDGIFADDDILASYAINEAEKFNRKIPEDLKIIGFDGTNLMQDLFPNLVTVVQPIEKIAQKSVEVLLQLIKHEQVESLYTLPVKLNK